MKKYTTILFAIMISAITTQAAVPIVNKLNSPKTIDNVRICALRVDFPEDDNELTTGKGKFLYVAETDDTLCSKFKIDPVPHNRAYFKDHINSLANFYSHASNGKLTIDTDNSEIYPLNDSETYTVSHKMDYYNPFLEDDSVDIKLAELFVEAVELADEEVNFSDYDLIILFHAGVGQDFAFDLDPTPYDIPSAYMNQADLQKALPGGASGISVDNGSKTITEGIILPESQNHILYEGWEDVFMSEEPFDYQIGLNGTIAFQFGFYLGIPAMFNTETGDAGIGRWGMMDQGSANLNGLVPPIPNAWVRDYMDWIDPTEAKAKIDVKLAYAESDADTLAWKIQIDNDEYYLVENRDNFLSPFWNLDSIRNKQYKKLDDNTANFPSVLPLVKDSIGAVFSNETGVLLSVPRYDVGLPGSGLLIYHIDETVIANNIATNSINNDRERRGVSIEEADGAEDIGFPVQNIFADYQNGWGFDSWYNTNEGFWDINQFNFQENNKSFIAFTDKTYPNTKTNDNVFTGIKIDSIGAAGERMHFVIDFESKSDNYPVAVNGVSDNSKLAFCDINDDGNDEIIVVSDKIYLFDSDGSLINSQEYSENPDNKEEVEILVKDNKLSVIYFENSCSFKEFEISSTGTFILNSDKKLGACFVASNLIERNNNIYCGLYDTNINKYIIKNLNEENSFSLDGEPVSIISNEEDIFVIYKNTFDFLVLDKNLVSIISAPKYGDSVNIISTALFTDIQNLKIILAVASEEKLYIHGWSTTEMSLKYSDIINPVSNVVISDIDNDGENDIIVASADAIYAYDKNLVLLQNFPVKMPNIFSGKSFGKNLLTANVDANSNTTEILAFVEDAGVIAINYKGEVVSGFPMATLEPIEKMEGLYNKDGEAYFLSINNNQMNSINISDNPITEKNWSTPDFNSYYYSYQPAGKTESNESLLDTKKTFCWPNPATDNYSYIRYFVAEECDITINIFDIAGNFVKSFANSMPNVNSFNEVAWDISSVQSGVYYAIVKAEKGSKSETKTVKIMVIK